MHILLFFWEISWHVFILFRTNAIIADINNILCQKINKRKKLESCSFVILYKIILSHVYPKFDNYYLPDKK